MDLTRGKLLTSTALSFFNVLFLQVLATCIWVLGTLLVARHVSPGVYGEALLTSSVLMTLSVLFVSWANPGVPSFGREEWTMEKSLGKTMGTRITISVICLILCLGILRGLSKSTIFLAWLPSTPFVAMSFWLIGISLRDMLLSIHQAVDSSLVFGLAPLVFNLVFTISVIVSTAFPGPVGVVGVAVLFIASVWVVVVMLGTMLPKGVWSHWRFDIPLALKIMKIGWFFPLGGLLSAVVSWVDPWMVRFYSNLASAGVFALATQIVTLVGSAFSVIPPLFTPKIVDWRLSGNTAHLQLYGRRCLRAVVVVSLVGSCWMILMEAVMRLFFSSNFYSDRYVFLYFTAVLPFQMIAYLCTPLTNAWVFLLPRMLLVSVGVAVSKIVINIAILPWLGVSGVIVSTFIFFAGNAVATVALAGSQIPGLISPTRFLLWGTPMIISALLMSTLPFLVASGMVLVLFGTILLGSRQMGIFHLEDNVFIEVNITHPALRRLLVKINGWLAGPKSLCLDHSC